MHYERNEAGILLPMTVMDGLTVNVLPNTKHEFLMTTKEVAIGYGTTMYALRKSKLRNENDFTEGKHYIIAGTNCPPGLNIPHNATLWTKRGIIRLGFFIKSERAKLFRDWAEELVIRVEEQRDLFGNPVVQPIKQLPSKRLINRLDRDRLIRLLALSSRITDNELRIAITNELTGGLNYGNI